MRWRALPRGDSEQWNSVNVTQILWMFPNMKITSKSLCEDSQQRGGWQWERFTLTSNNDFKPDAVWWWEIRRRPCSLWRVTLWSFPAPCLRRHRSGCLSSHAAHFPRAATHYSRPRSSAYRCQGHGGVEPTPQSTPWTGRRSVAGLNKVYGVKPELLQSFSLDDGCMFLISSLFKKTSGFWEANPWPIVFVCLWWLLCCQSDTFWMVLQNSSNSDSALLCS